MLLHNLVFGTFCHLIIIITCIYCDANNHFEVIYSSVSMFFDDNIFHTVFYSLTINLSPQNL